MNGNKREENVSIRNLNVNKIICHGNAQRKRALWGDWNAFEDNDRFSTRFGLRNFMIFMTFGMKFYDIL